MLTSPESSYGVIYAWTNRINQKIYVGQTTNIAERQQAYLHESKQSGPARLIISAMRKYGFDSFTLNVIDYADDKDALNFLEIMHIARLNAHVSLGGYNLNWGGTSVGARTESTRARMKSSSALYWDSPRGITQKQRLSEMYRGTNSIRYGKPSPNKGNSWTLTEEQKEHLRQINLGKTLSSEHRAAISKTRKLLRSGTHQWRIIHPDGTQEHIINLAEYCRTHHLNKDCMLQVSKGNQAHHQGYRCEKRTS